MVAVALASIAGCARPGAGPAGPTSAPTPLLASSSASNTGQPGRLAAIYLAVLRRYLTTSDNSFSAEHRFSVAYILKIADPAAGQPTGGANVPVVISDADQAAVVAGLADIVRVEFIADRTAVVVEQDRCQQVRNDGVLISLAPPLPVQPLPSGQGDRVEVGINGFVACLAATWFTYVVERSGTNWVVTGITGPIAIA
jgi:hypothetical protein